MKTVSIVCTDSVAAELVDALNGTLNAFDPTEITGVKTRDWHPRSRRPRSYTKDGTVWLGDLSGWEVFPHGKNDTKLVLFHRCGYDREVLAHDGFYGKYVGNLVALVLEDDHDCREYTL